MVEAHFPHLSFRLPPDVDCHRAMAAIDKVLKNDPPSDATVHLKWEEPANGWNAPKLSSWLDCAIQEASESFYGKPALAMGDEMKVSILYMVEAHFPHLSFRLPPDVDCHRAMAAIDKVLKNDPPSDATVHLKWEEPANGWNAPKLSSWLDCAIQEASESFYGKPALAMGEGGTIPFMAMLGEKFPEAQFVITGVLGPESNAHGPNEFWQMEYAKIHSVHGRLIQGPARL
jgi:hypothetical protein